MKRTKKYFIWIAIAGIFILKSVIWLFLFPVFQCPDEIRHYDYILHLAKGTHFPLGPNIVKPQNYYMKETADIADMVEFQRLVFHSKQQTKFVYQNEKLLSKVDEYSESNAETNIHDFQEIYLFAYEPLYYMVNAGVYLLGRVAGLDILHRFYSIRFVSIIFSFLSLLIVLKILDQIKVPPIIQVSSLVIVFLWPQFSMFSISVQPDVFSLFFISLITWLVLKDDEKFRYVILGLLLGFLGLVKFQYFACMLFSVTVFLILKQKRFNRIWISKLGVMILLSVAISSIWTLHNLLFYHAVHPGNTGFGTEIYTIGYKLKIFLFVIKGSTINSYIAQFGWLDTKVPNIYYLIVFIWLIFGLYSTIYITKHKLQQFNTNLVNLVRNETLLNYLILFLPLFVFTILMIAIAIFFSPLVNSQGRLYFPFIVPQLLILIYFPWIYFGKKKISYAYLGSITLFMLIIHIHSVLIILERYYGWHV